MRVKICGLRTPTDIEAAVTAGADAIGLVLAEGSPRTVSLDEAARLLPLIPDGICRVAVFADASASTLARAAAMGFDRVQTTTPHLLPIEHAAGLLPVCTDGPGLLHRVGIASSRSSDGAVLIDGPRGGGRGEVADLARVAALAWRHPLWLAGGLDPDNVAAAIHRVRPLGVDVSSGVEARRGVKDPRRIHAFVQAARAAAERLTQAAS